MPFVIVVWLLSSWVAPTARVSPSSATDAPNSSKFSLFEAFTYDSCAHSAVSTIKVFIARVLLAFRSESVTIIVQSEYVPSLKVRKVMVLLPLVAEVVPDEHEPP